MGGFGGVVDGNFGRETNSSSHLTAIEKAQAELKQKYDVREERKRELEFLEKGGNPLDYKFGPIASIVVHSDCVPEQLLEHESKESFGLATSPQGDSAESSGYPGALSRRESNFTDSVLFLDQERSGLHTNKRRIVSSSEQFSRPDGNCTPKETGDSASLPPNVKSHAYARRNRSKSNHDSSIISSTVQSNHRDKASMLPSPQSDHCDIKLQSFKALNDDNTTVCNSNTSLRERDVPENAASKDQLDMELDEVQPHEVGAVLAELPESCPSTEISEKLPKNNCRDHIPVVDSQKESYATVPPDLNIEGEAVVSTAIAPDPHGTSECLDTKKSCSNGFITCGIAMRSLQNENQAIEKCLVESIPYFSGKIDGLSNGGTKQLKLGSESSVLPETAETRENGNITVDLHSDVTGVCKSSSLNIIPQVEVEYDKCHVAITNAHGDLGSSSSIEPLQVNNNISLKYDGKFDNLVLDTNDCYEDTTCLGAARPGHVVPPVGDASDSSLSKSGRYALQTDIDNALTRSKPEEDAIVEEGRRIEVRLKKAQELPLCNFYQVKQQKSHWDYVLEEMAWLATDFMQERIWKIKAAAQTCQKIASSGMHNSDGSSICQNQRMVTQTLAAAVIRFWNTIKENKNILEKVPEHPLKLPVHRYAFRFLQFDCCPVEVVPAEAPKTPDRTSDAGSLEKSRETKFLHEILYYEVPSNAMHLYRDSMERHWLHLEKMVKNAHRLNFEAYVGDSASEEDEGGACYMPETFDSRSFNFSHKRKKTSLHLRKAGVSRSYAIGPDMPYVNNIGTQQSHIFGKRPAATINVGPIPTKRVRTAPRQRAVSPFDTSATRTLQITSRTDCSSGDTSSFQDDQSSLQGDFYPRKISEFESTAYFEEQLPFYGTESRKKPKKKPKHMGYRNSLNMTGSRGFAPGKCSSSEQRWPVNSMAEFEPKNYLKRRHENHPPEPPGFNGSKKSKALKQLPETRETLVPFSGAIPSSAASQMSNMSNSNKLIRASTNRERGRKNKSFKVANEQSGLGSPWSVFEDQTLVVLVHDMGPNWELVSDAINSSVQFKSVYRKPKECKERHKNLMEKNAGDGADSAEDSGSSQPYPSTLPGIPKGSARQLLQCLQEPEEEDTLKAHFEKIIHIGQKIHSSKVQMDNMDLKPYNLTHSSHLLALSQACPKNSDGGSETPFSLCDANASSPDRIPLGYQGAYANGIALPSNQGSAALAPSSSGSATILKGSHGMVMGNNFPSPTLVNAPRDTPRCGSARPASRPTDDQQRVQQYSQVVNRKMPGALPVGNDRGVRMSSGGNGMGVMSGMSRGLSMTRQGFQGIASPGVLNTASASSMLMAAGVGIPSAGSIHPGHGEGNSLTRPCDPLQMLRPVHNPKDHGQMMQDPQIQGTQGNGQIITPFNGISAPFSNQPVPTSPVQTFPLQQHQHQISQQPHMLSNSHHQHSQGTNHNTPQQQAFATSISKDRQLHQRLIHQQQTFSSSNAISTQLNSTQSPQPTQTSSSMTPISSSFMQRKQQSLARNPHANVSLPHQIIKQRQQQHIQQQQSCQQPQQRQQQQAKFMKGGGRGNSLMRQDSSVDASQAKGPASASSNQVLEKHMIQQHQSVVSGNSGPSLVLPEKSKQPQTYSRPSAQSSKQVAMPPRADSSQEEIPVSSISALLTPPQPSIPLSAASQNQHQRQTNQTRQTMHRVTLRHNHDFYSDNHGHVVGKQMTGPPSTQALDSATVVADISSASANHWKPEPSYEDTRSPPSHLPKSSQANLVGTEPLIQSSSRGLGQAHSAGGIPVHDQNARGSLQQQQQSQLQQPYPSPHQLHRQAGQSAHYGRPSNSGPG